jgi:hypothetical protein
MKTLIAHDTAEALLAASRGSRSVRTAHRLLALRDLMLGRARKWVCAQYGVSRENCGTGLGGTIDLLQNKF